MMTRLIWKPPAWILLLLLLVALPASGQLLQTFPTDDAGRPAPPAHYWSGKTPSDPGQYTLVSPGTRLPVATQSEEGGSPDLDPFGWGTTFYGATGLTELTNGAPGDQRITCHGIGRADYCLLVSNNPEAGGTFRVYQSLDGGATWTQLASGISAPGNQNDIHFVAGVSRTVIIAGNAGQGRRSTDGGATWTNISFPSTFIDYTVVVSSSQAILASSPTSGSVARSTDDGQSWSNVALPGGNISNLLALADGTFLAFTSTGAVHRSTDHGATWTQVASGVSGVNEHAAAYFGSGIVVAATTTGLQRSTDNGATWAVVTTIPDGVESMVAVGHGIGLIGTTNGKFWRTADFGQSWVRQQVLGGDLAGASIRKMAVLANGGVLAANSKVPAGGGACTLSGNTPDCFQPMYAPAFSPTKPVLHDPQGIPVGTSSNPLRIDPTGATTQPVQSTAANAGGSVLSTAGSVTAAGNTSGLTTSLDCQGNPFVSTFANAGAAATVTFQVSLDNTTWHTYMTLLSAASGDAFLDATLGWRYVRLTSATTGVDLTFELTCKP